MARTDGYFVSEPASADTFVDLLDTLSFVAKPGTVGFVAVPPKSPVNCTFPDANVVASGAPEATAILTALSTYVLAAR